MIFDFYIYYRPGGGIGIREGLKILCPLRTCGFESHPGHHKNLKIQKSNSKILVAHELIHELIHEQLCLKTMSNIKFQNRKIRKLSKVGKGRSFAVTIPIEYIKKLGWKERQKLVVELKNQSIIIKDWKK